MSKICDVCQKGYQKGNLVPRGIGRRVTKRTITMRHPNLRARRFEINGTSVKLMICSSCLKRLKFEENKAKVAAAAEVTA
jgi:large subunit ribosomal protein L28